MTAFVNLVVSGKGEKELKDQKMTFYLGDFITF